MERAAAPSCLDIKHSQGKAALPACCHFLLLVHLLCPSPASVPSFFNLQMYTGHQWLSKSPPGLPSLSGGCCGIQPGGLSNCQVLSLSTCKQTLLACPDCIVKTTPVTPFSVHSFYGFCSPRGPNVWRSPGEVEPHKGVPMKGTEGPGPFLSSLFLPG